MATEVSTTLSGQIARLTRTEPERVPVLDWALTKAARIVAAGRAAAASPVDSQAWAGAIVSDGQAGQVYNEEAFRYFLEIEEKRAERSQVPFFLLLISPRDEQTVAPAIASKLFEVLRPCVRDTDFTGWYRQDFVVGAVLTQLGPTTAPEVTSAACALIVDRVTAALSAGMPASYATAFDVQICEVPMAPVAVESQS